MKVRITGICIMLLALVLLASPVMAIGPYQADAVGNNKNLTNFGAAVGNLRGESGGSIYWIWVENDQHWIRWQYQIPTQAKGLMNQAIIAQYTGAEAPSLPAYLFLVLGSDDYDNMWIYLSGDGGSNPSQYNGHGMIYWHAYYNAIVAGATPAQAAVVAANIVSTYPDGELWKHTDIYAPA